MKKALLLFYLLLSQLHFGQCNDKMTEFLRGVWVKETSPRDTIKFDMVKHGGRRFELILADEKRPQGGPAGLYEYAALHGAMLVHWLPSSNYIPETISFFIDSKNNAIILGNFYRKNTEGKSLRFRKIK